MTRGNTRSSDNANKRKLLPIYLQCYFVAIATILGTGVLGLPVKLSRSGLYPFLISFILAYIMQALLIVFFTDLLQKLQAKQVTESQNTTSERLPLNDVELEREHEEEFESRDSGMSGHNTTAQEEDEEVKQSNLHLLGVYFLPAPLRPLFDLLLLAHFVALLISYALAGSEAFASLLNIEYIFLISPFVWILTFAIIFAFKFIQPVVSFLTFLKGSLLIATVAVTLFVGSSVQQSVISDFTYIGSPFLIGTVALGGTINVMPLLYNKIRPVKEEIRGYRLSVLLGLTTCTILNIVWCWAVLDIVPQMNTCYVEEKLSNSSLPPAMFCAVNISLETAEINGEISTVPLTRIIHERYPEYFWVARVVQCFIMLSITVSFLTMGAALQHTLIGWIDNVCSMDRVSVYVGNFNESRAGKCVNTQCILRIGISFMAFGLVYTIAMINPKGFISLLEVVASLLLNVEAGLFVFVMLMYTNTNHNRFLRIPDALSPCLSRLQYSLPIYFGFAVVYDIFLVCYERAKPGQPLPWETGGRPQGSLVYINSTSGLVNHSSHVHI